MLTRIVRFTIEPQQVIAFCQATAQHAKKSRTEIGITRFEVFQDEAKPENFYLIITFKGETDRKQHFGTEHYLTWHAIVSPMFTNAPEGVTCREVP